jgi:hypothetical protein
VGDFFIDLDQEHIKEVQKIIFRAVTLHSDVSGESLEIQERLRKLDIPFFLVDSKSGKLILKAKGNQMIEGYEAINQYLDQLDK